MKLNDLIKKIENKYPLNLILKLNHNKTKSTKVWHFCHYC